MEKLINKHNNLINALKALERIIQKHSNPPSHADAEDMDAYATTLIKRFELTQEMMWKYYKAYLKLLHGVETLGSKDVFRQCFTCNIINESETELLLDMIEDRNLTTHNYDTEIVKELCSKITVHYFPLMKNIHQRTKHPS